MKNLVKLIGIIALVATIGFSTACDFGGSDDSNGNENGGNNGGGGGGTNPTITIRNNTGYTIEHRHYGVNDTVNVWIKPSTEAQSWGYELAGSSDFKDGTSRTFTLSQSLSAQNIYDIRIKAGGYNFTEYNVTVSEGMILTFTTSDLEQ